MSFTILTGKEGISPKKPLFLVSITAPDGDSVKLTTAAYYGAPSIVYNSQTYYARIIRNDIQTLQAMGPQGYDTLPGFTLVLADADKTLWMNHASHGWRGATITLTVVLWDVAANAYSTDALQWSFLGGTATHDHGAGTTTVEATSSCSFTRLKVPNVPIQYRCPWDFPPTYADRVEALNNPASIYYQCGYSADVTGGVGNLQSGGAAFTTCEYVRSIPTDPTVGCMARLGDATKTAVAPDGDITHDKANNYTGRFGGVTWLAPATYSGRQYTSGQRVFGFNQPNTSLAGSYHNMVYGTQWVQCQVLAPAADPNSLRSEVVVCLAPFGPATVNKLIVNGVEVPQNGSDPLFTWRYINQGGRNGALNADAIYNRHGDPHGSKCVVEFVVPAQLASGGSVPNVQALVTGGPILNCYAISSVSGGTVTFTGPNWACAGNPPYTVIIVGNSNPSLNRTWNLSSWTGGTPGTVTLSGTSLSGTGGAVFFFANPDLWDTGGSIVTNPTGMSQNIAGPACNLVYAYLDLLAWGNTSLNRIDGASWYNAAQIARTSVSYKAADGSTQSHAQFKASFALSGNSRQALSQVLTGLRNSGNLMVGVNNGSGLIQCYVKQTLADQQPSPVSGSNDSTPRTSKHADGTTSSGYFAYLFDASNIKTNSLKVLSTRIESTPNMVSFQFQDEYNGYQQDSMTEIDPAAYAYSGNNEIGVPVVINAVPNFDQGMRIANTALAEALFGNQRNDAGGTLFFEFETNHRVLHLTSRLGYICGLSWPLLGIGSSNPQPVRVLSITPDTDGESWRVRCAWHNDDWYTYAYGQDPTQFQRNPLQAPPDRPPYPWRPGIATWGTNDAMFPSQNSFQFDVDTSIYPAKLTISGKLPRNRQITDGSKPPLVPLQGTTGQLGGYIAPGTYQVAFSCNGQVGPVSNFVTVVVPSGTNTNTITVSGIQWQSGAAPAIQPFIGPSTMDMRACDSAHYTTASPDGNGNPTSFTFTRITPDGLGLPDIKLNQFLIEETGIVHGGVFGDTIQAIDGTGKVITVGNPSAFTTNQWQNRVLSLYYRPGATSQPALNALVVSNTGSDITVDQTGFQVGDVVVMRTKATTVTTNTIGDSQLINAYAPSGLSPSAEPGNMIFIYSGTGAFQAPKTVASATSTVYTIVGTWDVLPDSSSIFMVLAPTVAYSYYTKAVSADGGGGVSLVAQTPAITTEELSLLVSVATADADGVTAPWQYQAMREVFIPPQALAQIATVSVTY